MKLWVPNNKNKLELVLLGSVPTVSDLKQELKAPIPYAIEKCLQETHEDLAHIRTTYEKLGVEVLSYPTHTINDGPGINVRNGFLLVDDTMYVTSHQPSLTELYTSVDRLVHVPHTGGYCPDIYIHDDYAILDGLQADCYKWWRERLGEKRKIVTAFNQGHSDGIYCNVADKIWLTNGESLNFKKYWPDMEVLDLSTTSKGNVNNWLPVEHYHEMRKTTGRYVIQQHKLTQDDIDFIDDYLKHWVNYCEETLFDINLSVIDRQNIIVISQHSLIYDRLEKLDIQVHKVPFRHRFFWDGGLHCITNDLRRKK